MAPFGATIASTTPTNLPDKIDNPADHRVRRVNAFSSPVDRLRGALGGACNDIGLRRRETSVAFLEDCYRYFRHENLLIEAAAQRHRLRSTFVTHF